MESEISPRGIDDDRFQGLWIPSFSRRRGRRPSWTVLFRSISSIAFNHGQGHSIDHSAVLARRLDAAPVYPDPRAATSLHHDLTDPNGGCDAPEGIFSSDSHIADSNTGQITEALKPTSLEIHNDSSLHAHHQAMAGNTSRETHFRVVITSDAFNSKMQPARHRMVYALLKEEMAKEGGIHALQLRTRTPEEEKRQLASEAEKDQSEAAAA